MTHKILYILSVLSLLFGFTACSSEDDITEGGQKSEVTGDDVIVKAGIGANSVFTRSNPIGNAQQQREFKEGDLINVSSDNTDGVYRYTNGAWVDYSNSDNFKNAYGGSGWKSLKWDTNTKSFYAFYPLEDVYYSSGINPAPIYFNDTYYNVNVKQDQSTENALEMSDIMFAKALDFTKPASHTVTFTFERQTARVFVKLSYNEQFKDYHPVVGNITVYGGESVTKGDVFSGLDSYKAITPYKMQDNEYVALVCPRPAKTDQTFLELTINHDEDKFGKTSTDSLKITGTQALEAGKSYTFNVLVGKEYVDIESVTVNDWQGEKTITGGEATERKR